MMLTIHARAAGISLLAAALCLASGTVAPGQTTLRYKFKEGESLKYALTMNTQQTDIIGGAQNTSGTTQEMDLAWTIKGVKAGQADIVQKITRLHHKLEVSGVPRWEFDSKSGKKPSGAVGKDLNPLLEALASAELALKMDAQGQTTDPRLFHKMLEAIKANPNLAPAWSPLSAERISHTLQQPLLIFPKEPVVKGKTWNKKTESQLSNGFILKVDTTFTYSGPETRNKQALEKIEAKSVLTVEPGDRVGLTPMLLSATAGGTSYFDNQAGRLLESTQTQKIALEFKAGGQTYGASRDQTITLKFVR